MLLHHSRLVHYDVLELLVSYRFCACFTNSRNNDRNLLKNFLLVLVFEFHESLKLLLAQLFDLPNLISKERLSDCTLLERSFPDEEFKLALVFPDIYSRNFNNC